MFNPRMDRDPGAQDFLEYVYDYHKSLISHEIILVYEGWITQQVTRTFTSLTETSLLQYEEKDSVQRRVFHVMVECLQNISKHADCRTCNGHQYCGRGLLLVSKGEEEYCITTGNAIVNEKIAGLGNWLDYINKLEKQELKELYMKRIREGKFNEKGGAGLGLIDIKRKTNKELEYKFLPTSRDTSFFLLTTSIPRYGN